MTPTQIITAFVQGTITYEQAASALLGAGWSQQAISNTLNDVQNWTPQRKAQWMAGQPAGTPYIPPDTTGTRANALFEQEARPENVFQQYLAGNPLYGRLSELGREAMERQYEPQRQSFLAQAENPLATFRDYLQRGAQALNPQAMQTRLGQIAGYFDIDPAQRNEQQSAMVERYASNPNAFAAYLNPLMARVNPLFRGAVGNVAENIYDRFMGTTPEQSFLQYMAKRGGFFGGI